MQHKINHVVNIIYQYLLNKQKDDNGNYFKFGDSYQVHIVDGDILFKDINNGYIKRYDAIKRKGIMTELQYHVHKMIEAHLRCNTPFIQWTNEELLNIVILLIKRQYNISQQDYYH